MVHDRLRMRFIVVKDEDLRSFVRLWILVVEEREEKLREEGQFMAKLLEK